MKVTVKVDIDTAKIMRQRGLGGDFGAQRFLASEVVRLCDPYVPMQQGMLKNQRIIAQDGSSVTYTQPYAHYQYYGEAMAGRAPKKYTGNKLVVGQLRSSFCQVFNILDRIQAGKHCRERR